MLGLGATALLAACVTQAPTQAPAEAPPAFTLHFEAELLPDQQSALASITVTQPAAGLRELDFNAPRSRYSDFSADGELTASGDRTIWSVPADGGVLRYRVRIDRLRGGAYQARLTEDWGIFRLDQLFPAARTRASAGATSIATLTITGPAGWRFESPYGPTSEPVHTVTSERLFRRPAGWAIAGQMGVRRDEIAGRNVAIAAPLDEGFRRQDMLAFLRWTLPTLTEVFPTMPDRLLIVGSARDMWRGGLSGPGSLYIHPDRPLVSGNATSTLLHELAHVALGSTASNSDDWVVEGLAEYYSLEILRRSGGISQQRFDDALQTLDAWSNREGGRLTNPSTGADTAHAVLVLHDLDRRLRAKRQTMDSVVRALIATEQFTAAALEAQLSSRGIELPAALTSSAPGP